MKLSIDKLFYTKIGAHATFQYSKVDVRMGKSRIRSLNLFMDNTQQDIAVGCDRNSNVYCQVTLIKYCTTKRDFKSYKNDEKVLRKE